MVTVHMRTHRRAAVSLLAAAALALSAAGCGAAAAGSPTSHPSSTQTAAQGTTGGNSSTSTGPLAFAACMRAHGITDFPDPGNGGRMQMRVSPTQITVNGVTLKESAAQFQTANQACQSKMGGNAAGGPPNPALQKIALQFANCMRTHGVPNFPDPKVSGNGVQIQINRSAGINPQSPQFQQAQSTCQPLMAAALKSRGQAGAANGGNG